MSDELKLIEPTAALEESYRSYVAEVRAADDTLVPIRLTQNQLQQAAKTASRNMDDCPTPPSKLEEWFEQLACGKDIKR